MAAEQGAGLAVAAVQVFPGQLCRGQALRPGLGEQAFHGIAETGRLGCQLAHLLGAGVIQRGCQCLLLRVQSDLGVGRGQRRLGRGLVAASQQQAASQHQGGRRDWNWMGYPFHQCHFLVLPKS